MIRYVLFDLDNTLYPCGAGMEEAMTSRICDFVARHLGVPCEEAYARRRDRMKRYGTTLEWLMAEEGLSDVDAYYACVHPEGEEEGLEPDPRVRAFLEGLPVPSSVLTNSPKEHADRVLRKLELEGLFERVFDIRWNGLEGKPAEGAFRRVLDAIGFAPEEVLFVDDFPSYVAGYVRIGGRGVLLDERGVHEGAPYPRVGSLRDILPLLDGGAA